MSFQRILITAALLAATSPAAHALELFTALDQAPTGALLRCAITNVGTKPIEVFASIVGNDGSDLNVASTCSGNPAGPATLDPGKACYMDSTIPGTKIGYCHFTATSSKVRGSLLVVTTNGVTSALPATK